MPLSLPATNNPLPPVNDARSVTHFQPHSLPSTRLLPIHEQPLPDRRTDADETVIASYKESGDFGYLLSQLCELNLALFQHPLQRERQTPKSQQQSISGSGNEASGQSPDDSHLDLSELGIGKLLKMTHELKELVTRMRAAEEGHSPDKSILDASTALMVLSCYTRFDTLFTRAIEILRRMRNRTQHLNDIHQLMPHLVIDGFCMSTCYDVHLDFVIHLCEQIHDRIKSCVCSGGRALAFKSTEAREAT